MAITKQRKDELLDIYRDLLDRSKGLILTRNEGLDMGKINAVRAALRDKGAEYHIAKNTLLGIVLKEKGYDVPNDVLTGSTAVGFAFDDIAAVTKVMLDFAKNDDMPLSIKGGGVEGQYFSASDLEALSKLPPLPVIRAQLLGMLNTPASQLAGVVASGVRQVVNVLNAYAEKDNQPAEAAA